MRLPALTAQFCPALTAVIPVCVVDQSQSDTHNLRLSDWLEHWRLRHVSFWHSRDTPHQSASNVYYSTPSQRWIFSHQNYHKKIFSYNKYPWNIFHQIRWNIFTSSTAWLELRWYSPVNGSETMTRWRVVGYTFHWLHNCWSNRWHTTPHTTPALLPPSFLPLLYYGERN